MRKFLLIVFLLTILFSCDNKGRIIGHWHEFTNNNTDFRECIIINDSTFSINQFTKGGDFGRYKNLNEILHRNYYDSLIYQNYSFEKGEIKINDSIKWISQKENIQTFLNDFSAGLKIEIEPFINKFSKNDTINNSKLNILIFIGKHKDFAKSDVIINPFYFQLNEITTNNESSFLRFLSCRHCEVNDYNYIINSDSQINKPYMDNILSLMNSMNIRERNIYFRYADTIANKYGYKNIKEIDEFIK